MECRVATTFDWEWGPSTLQRLGKAQALRFIYTCMYRCLYIYVYINHPFSVVQKSFGHHLDDLPNLPRILVEPWCPPHLKAAEGNGPILTCLDFWNECFPQVTHQDEHGQIPLGKWMNSWASSYFHRFPWKEWSRKSQNGQVGEGVSEIFRKLSLATHQA